MYIVNVLFSKVYLGWETPSSNEYDTEAINRYFFYKPFADNVITVHAIYFCIFSSSLDILGKSFVVNVLPLKS